MVKKHLILILILSSPIFSETFLEKNCLNCHKREKIPSELIYRRYLTQFSTHRVIKEKLQVYLKGPKKELSIMPKQFFLKFPPKNALDLNETQLKKGIELYLKKFDVKKQLTLP